MLRFDTPTSFSARDEFDQTAGALKREGDADRRRAREPGVTTFEMLARGRDRMSALAEDRWADLEDENDKQNDDENRCSDADVHAPPLSSVRTWCPPRAPRQTFSEHA